MSSVIDDRGYNQGFELVKSTEIRMRRRAQWMINSLDNSTSKAILEIGCGTGEVSYWIVNNTQHKVVGSDLCVPFIEEASKKYVNPNLSYEVLDFNKPDDIKNRKFDYIIGNGILHHLYYNLTHTFQTFKEILNEDGKIIFMEPNIYNPYCAVIFNIPFMRKWANLEPDEMAFSKDFITKELYENGFKNIKVDYKDFLLPGVPDFAVNPLIQIGNILEKTPLRVFSQSIFITAVK